MALQLCLGLAESYIAGERLSVNTSGKDTYGNWRPLESLAFSQAYVELLH